MGQYVCGCSNGIASLYTPRCRTFVPTVVFPSKSSKVQTTSLTGHVQNRQTSRHLIKEGNGNCCLNVNGKQMIEP